MADFRQLKRSKDSEKFISVQISPHSLYCWNARFIGFDSSDCIFNDLQRHNVDGIDLELTFGAQFPNLPPFVRVVKPIFAFRTGHVTMGGAICHSLLASDGWLPSFSVEALLLELRSLMLDGQARLDSNQDLSQYSEHAARSAFSRAMNMHNWKV
ncbi:hypothetical protein GEMRC1_012564 [Eukaryota sp. GEM-RC1]